MGQSGGGKKTHRSETIFGKNHEKCFLFYLKNFLVMYQNSLVRKIRLISNFMMSRSGQTIVIHILPNILRSKGNQTMKFGQLIECNMRNIFLEKSYTK